MIIGAGFWFSNHKTTYSPFKNNPERQKIVAESLGLEQINKDSDNDGLKDWEEALWKTDPNNPDTDEDGALDGQEVIENHNPLIPGPEDYFEDTQIQNQNSASFPEASSLTEAFSQQFFNEYLALKQEKGTLSQEDKDNLLNEFLDGFKNLSENKGGIYRKSDIRISAKSDVNSIKNYGNQLALIIKKYFDPIPESEMAIFQKFAASQNESELSKLKPIADAYRNTAKEALLLETPQNFSDSHLAIINNFNEISQEIEAMQNISEDPIQALSATKNYQETALKTYQILKEMNSYFSKNGVIFGIYEPASLFKAYL